MEESKFLKIASYSLLAIAIMFAVMLLFTFNHKRDFDHMKHHATCAHHHHHYDSSFKAFHCKIKADMDKLFDKIDVTPEQKAKLKEIRKSAKKESEPIIDTMIDKKKELIKYMAMPDAEEQIALEKRNEIMQLHKELSEIHIKSIFEAKKVLTPEQAKQISEYHQKHLDKFKEDYKSFDDDDCSED